MPPTTTRIPRSCTPDGSSSTRSIASTTAITGWSVSTTELSDAGTCGSAAVMSSQPSTCDVSARTSSQPAASHDVPKSSSPRSSPAGTITIADASVAWNSAPDERRASVEPARRTSRKPAYAIAVRIPNTAPSVGSSP